MVDGFSSADPSLAIGPQIDAGEATRRRRSGGGRSSTTAPPSVSIDGGTVFIGGAGFSVAPSLQAEFIRSRTGGRGSSAQAAISQAQENARAADQQRQAAQASQAQAARSQRVQAVLRAREQAGRDTGFSSADPSLARGSQKAATTQPQQFISKVTSQSTRDKSAADAEARRERAQRFRIGLSEKEKEMTTGEVIKGRFKEVGIGITKAGIGFAEGSLNLFSQLGVQTLEIDEATGKLKERKKVKFGGKVGEVRDLPATTGSVLGQAQIILPALGGAGASIVTGISSVGVAETARRTAGSFSPIKIRPGSFGALESADKIKNLKFDVVSTKSVKGDVTTRNIIGATGKSKFDVSVVAKQTSKIVGDKEVGRVVADISAQRTTISRSGRIETGFRILRTDSSFVSQRGQPSLLPGADITQRISLEGITGGSAKVFSRTTLDLVVDKTSARLFFNPDGKVDISRVGGISEKGDKFTLFSSGRESRVDSIGRIKKLNIRGIEFDIKNINKGPTFDIVGDATGSRSSPPGFDKLLFKLPKTGPIIATPISSITQPSNIQVGQTIANLAIVSTKFPAPIPTVKTAPAPAVVQAPAITKTKVDGFSSADSSLARGPQVIQSPEIKVAQLPRLEILQTPAAAQRSRSKSSTRVIQLPAVIQTPTQTPSQQSAIIQQPSIAQIPQQTLRPTFPVVPGFGSPKPIKDLLEPPIIMIPKLAPAAAPRSPGSFGVQIRRGGQFFSIGNFKTQQRAFQVGLGRTRKSLAATFRLTSPGKIPGAPKGFRIKKTDLGTLFIERRGQRLSTGSETREIIAAKGRKSKKKKKSRGKKK